MRDYLSLHNFWKALALGSVVTVMAVPRIVQGELDVRLYGPAALAAMTLVGGAVTAWSRHGQMCGAFPDTRRLLVGLGLATLLCVLLLPVYRVWLDPIFRAALEQTGNERLLRLRYPATWHGALALLLWSAGFEALFFVAGSMSFMARLTRCAWISGIGVVALRVLVVSRMITDAGIMDGTWLFLGAAAVSTALSCLLFARTGLPAVMLFAAGLNLHLFLG